VTFRSASEKRQYVRSMFGRIAHRYDLMNRLMTGGQDIRWRQWLVQLAALPAGGRLLDVATGTGDVAFSALRLQPQLGLVVGADFSLPMLAVGQKRAAADGALTGQVRWTAGDTLCLPFPDDTFDAVTSAFLLRNVTDLAATLGEQRRVTRPGGRVVALDVPRPPDGLGGQLFRFYFRRLVPRLGSLISGQPDAYAYLPRSADVFLRPEQLAGVMQAVGLHQVSYRMVMLGTVALHAGVK
jgi:demethylmenaquinone methyltransferase/2-methoxy-6-polyprenyl-1,4-benzoquinol methylase